MCGAIGLVWSFGFGSDSPENDVVVVSTSWSARAHSVLHPSPLHQPTPRTRRKTMQASLITVLCTVLAVCSVEGERRRLSFQVDAICASAGVTRAGQRFIMIHCCRDSYTFDSSLDYLTCFGSRKLL